MSSVLVTAASARPSPQSGLQRGFVGRLGIQGDSVLSPPLGFLAKLVHDPGPGKLGVAPPREQAGELLSWLGQRAPGPKRELQEAAEITTATMTHL